jgi:hypothetical protein
MTRTGVVHCMVCGRADGDTNQPASSTKVPEGVLRGQPAVLQMECHKTCKPETVTWRHGDHIPWLSQVQFYDPTGGRIRTLLLGGNLP